VPHAASHRRSSPPSFLRLAGHPIRWRLLTELAHGDRRVGELCARLHLRQSLVSYHLAQLRSEGMVICRRSSADGRDSYYLLDLERCRGLLAGTGAALHPGLSLARQQRVGKPAAGKPPVRVLFSCTGNSARSQMAEGLAERLGDGRLAPVSAGSNPKPLHPNAVRVMRDYGIDLEGRSSKPLSQFSAQRFDYVITLCDRVREVCPEFPGHPELIHWSTPDPGREGETDADTYQAFQRTAAELTTRIRFLLDVIDEVPSGKPSRAASKRIRSGSRR
jgi:ArsR family transcriptional regulator, arsenate/arsenite/antimonite-responsive transcriptional repressor / arsenate reductase (thioredoxin)